ncbi:MAG: alpha/beta hydrolase [Ruminiclostridium sp.]|nr:alpha/beta hydrolase [Ruminiclostridium sp.]
MNVVIDGLNIHYLKEGNGENVLVLQGWGTEIELYSAVIAQLSKKYTVYAPDFAGFGKSDEPPEPWSIDDYADFVIKFCKETGIDGAILFGHSFGCRVIIKLLSRENCPVKVERVILTGAAGIKPVQSESAKKKASAYQRGKAFLSTSVMKKLFPNALERLRSKHGSADYRAASPMMRQVLVKTVNEDLSHLLPLVKQEVLLIWGRNDDATPIADGERMEKEMPDAGLAVIENAGHFAFIEQQNLFLRIVSSFLGIE